MYPSIRPLLRGPRPRDARRRPPEPTPTVRPSGLESQPGSAADGDGASSLARPGSQTRPDDRHAGVGHRAVFRSPARSRARPVPKRRQRHLPGLLQRPRARARRAPSRGDERSTRSPSWPWRVARAARRPVANPKAAPWSLPASRRPAASRPRPSPRPRSRAAGSTRTRPTQAWGHPPALRLAPRRRSRRRPALRPRSSPRGARSTRPASRLAPGWPAIAARWHQPAPRKPPSSN